MSRRKKKRRAGATVWSAQLHNEGSRQDVSLTPGSGSPQDSRAPSAGGRGNVVAIDHPGQSPKLARQVPIFPPLGTDRCDIPIDTVPEYLARKLVADRIGTFAKITKHLSGVRLFPEPPRATVKRVSIRGGSFDAIIDHDTVDNPTNVFSYANKPIFEYYVDLKGRRKRRRIPATTQTYKVFHEWVRDSVFRRVLLDVLKPAA